MKLPASKLGGITLIYRKQEMSLPSQLGGCDDVTILCGVEET